MPVDRPVEVTTISGIPSFALAAQLEREMRADAGLADRPARERSSPTAFHVAGPPGGRPLGAATTTIGPLAEVPLGLALTRAGVDLPSSQVLPDPVCELVSLAVNADAGSSGIPELLYRAFYREAQANGARSIVVGLDPWVLDIMREDYGIPLVTLGPLLDLLGRELLPSGGAMAELMREVAATNPVFARFLDAPD